MKTGWLGLAAALVVAIGIAVAGVFVAAGLENARTGDRFVTVKGLAEREVRADLALWPLRFVATGNDLSAVQAKVSADAETVRAFLDSGGIRRDAVELQSLQVTDLYAQAYRQGPAENRFIVAQTLSVRTTDVDAVAGLAQRVGELVEAGVVLGGEGHGMQGPSYLFTRLNAIKPKMIAEATAAARAAAERFAADSGGHLAGIRRARQGVFQILPRDKAPGLQESKQILKTVRVVSTLDFALTD